MTFTEPAGAVDGDIIIANIYVEKNADTNALDTVPAGFTEWGRKEQTGPSPDIHQYVLWWRKSGAKTYTFGKTGAGFMAGDMIAVSGAIATGDPADVFGVFATAGSGTSLTATSITVTSPNTLLVFCGVDFNGTNLTSDAVMTERSDSNSSCIDTQFLPWVGATGTRAATCGFSDAWVSVLVAIKPPANPVLQTQNGADSTTVSTLSVALPVTAGDTIVVTGSAIRGFVAGDVTDDASNTWVLDETNSTAGQYGVGIWRCQSALTTATITITLNASVGGRSHIVAQSLRGLTASPLDVHTNGTGTSTAVASGTTGATAQADEWVVACAHATASTITSPAGGGSGTYTSAAHLDNALASWESSYLETVASGTQAATWTAGTSVVWRACIVAYLITVAAANPGLDDSADCAALIAEF